MRYVAAFLLGGILMTANAESAVVLFERNAVEVAETLPDPTDLWVPSAELKHVNGFELKPEGLCYEEICIPVREGHNNLVVDRDGATWVNVTELARKIGQAYVVDTDTGVWSFGEIPQQVASTLGSAVAPDFELTDRDGDTVRLSDFRGKKVLLLTWASW